MNTFTNDEITEDDELTMDEQYEARRILSLPENLQTYAIEHKQNELDAMPSYFDRLKLQGGRS